MLKLKEQHLLKPLLMQQLLLRLLHVNLLTQDFLATYEEAHILPHGFANTAPGTGHLNEEGCRMIAEKLCDTILMLEAEK